MKYLAWLWSVTAFIPFYIFELVHANLRIAHDVITPEDLSDSCLLELDVRGLSQRQILLLSNLLTFTPGTICADFDDNHKHLWIHFLYQDEVPVLKTKIQRMYIPFIKGVMW